MDDAECDRQFTLWKDHAANHMLQAAHALMETIRYADEDEEITPFVNVAEFLIEQAESLRPDGACFPEYPDNVVPISTAMRRK